MVKLVVLFHFLLRLDIYYQVEHNILHHHLNHQVFQLQLVLGYYYDQILLHRLHLLCKAEILKLPLYHFHHFLHNQPEQDQ